jgi:GNAT superfamily N-acetyltransferase
VGWFSLKDTSQTVFVDHFYVSPSHRQRRVGSILMTYIIDAAKSKGKKVSLEVINGSSARTFFEKLGFAEISKMQVTSELMLGN